MICPVDFEGWRVRVATSPHPWPSKSIRRASVNSLGIGGSTAHAVVEFFDPSEITNGSVNGINGHHEVGDQGNNPSFLLFTSGASRSSRDQNTLKLLEFLKSHIECQSLMRPLVEKLNARSQIQTRPWKSYVVAKTVDDLIQQLENKAAISNSAPSSGVAPRIFFTFTGQGAMWSQMGKRLLETFPVARATLYNLEQILQELQSSNKSAWSLTGASRQHKSQAPAY